VGKLKRYDVSGLEVEGRIAPGGTLLMLDDVDAERMGLKASSKGKGGDDEAAVQTKKQAAPRSGRRPVAGARKAK
jgi:hypothetical protein